jgi:hypothetical protein
MYEVDVKGKSDTDPLKQVEPRDLPDCGNPGYQGLGNIPTATDYLPTRLLGWFGTEKFYNLTSIRNVSPSMCNYFW